ncbi:MAG: hypothetical protein JWO67_2661 [Streptosporangiaceae bacterium]|nr:hypothetical protein [Streptosporangiaceae bacterium]
MTNQQSAECRAALRALEEAQQPTERAAAMFLARAQRDLATARASSPAEIADQPDVTDPEKDYAAWVERMVESERRQRASALVSPAAGRRDDDSPNPARQLHDAELAAVYADAVARARAAIAAMTGPDPARATAAQADVLDRWMADDRADAAALVARFEQPGA